MAERDEHEDGPLREVEALADGRRITYYTRRDAT